MKLHIFLFIGGFLIFSSCKKNKEDKRYYDFQLEVVSGDHQSDTIGRILKDSLKVKAFLNNTILPKYVIKIVQIGCDHNNQYMIQTDRNGIASFSWRLNSGAGDQVLKLFLLDSLYNILDSTTATAKGVMYDHGWMPADCLPVGASPSSFAQLDDGRILCGLGQVGSSDNNGISWQMNQKFPADKLAIYVAAIGTHLFAAHSSSFQHSPDNGKTWQPVTNASGDFSSFSIIKTTRSGKVFINAFGGVYMSVDSGLSWRNISNTPNGLRYSGYYHSITESPNGDLYAVNSVQDYSTSTDGGITWITAPFSTSVQGVFADDNGDVYRSINAGNQTELQKKVNNSGGPWTLVCSFAQIPGVYASITEISKVNNNYYFLVAGYGLMKTADFISIKNIKSGSIISYCITKANVAIVAQGGTPDHPIVYNINP